MMHSESGFRILLIFMLILIAYATDVEWPKLPNSCHCSHNDEETEIRVECRGLCPEELQKVFLENSENKFGIFKIVRSKLIDVNQIQVSNVTIKKLEFRFSEIETFHLFESLNWLKNLSTLVIDHVDVKTWKFTSADEINNLIHMRELLLLDCPEGNEDGIQVVPYLPENMTSIEIKWCRLNSEQKISFQRFSNLQKLDLSYNHLTTFSRSYLPRPAEHLWYFSLSKNPISSLPNDIFLDMPALSTVHLQSMHLTTFSYDAFKHILNQLQSVQLALNPLNCDCENSWIMIKASHWKSQIPTCVTPKALEGERLDFIDPKDMCQPKGENFQKILEEYCSVKITNETYLK